MADISVSIAAGRPRVGGMYGRTPVEFAMLVNEMTEEPGHWFIYSNHLHMPSAHTRASRLRHNPPAALVAVIDRLEFKAYNHEQHGAVVLVRLASGDTPS